MRQALKQVGKFTINTSKTYLDEKGNYATVVKYPEGENDWAVVRLSREGDVEHIEGFKNETTAISVLNKIAVKNDWKLYSEQR